MISNNKEKQMHQKIANSHSTPKVVMRAQFLLNKIPLSSICTISTDHLSNRGEVFLFYLTFLKILKVKTHQLYSVPLQGLTSHPLFHNLNNFSLYTFNNEASPPSFNNNFLLHLHPPLSLLNIIPNLPKILWQTPPQIPIWQWPWLR